jgi:hypothetical protein
MKRRMQSYVYRVTNPETGEFYIGCRSVAHGAATDDTHYLGKGIWPWLTRKKGVYLSEEIIAVFSNLKDARLFERYEILRNHANDLCRNRMYLIGKYGRRIPITPEKYAARAA